MQLRTVDTWEGLAGLASGETDIALMGLGLCALANHEAGAQAVATILYEGKPEYHALIVTHPASGLASAQDPDRAPRGRACPSRLATRLDLGFL